MNYRIYLTIETCEGMAKYAMQQQDDSGGFSQLLEKQHMSERNKISKLHSPIETSLYHGEFVLDWFEKQ